jgi:hypothetical protein
MRHIVNDYSLSIKFANIKNKITYRLVKILKYGIWKKNYSYDIEGFSNGYITNLFEEYSLVCNK